ncbi:MAG: UbiA family prenyltransferase [bacterium]|nr:UbiA family prenyltransferase [bacterium]
MVALPPDMDAREGANAWAERPQALAAAVRTAPAVSASPSAARDLLWALTASTLHRVRRGEGALLAINLSLIATRATDAAQAVAAALVSLLVIAAMYAVNDLWDAPADATNPKKDPALVAVYLERRALAVWSVLGLKTLTLLFAAATLGPAPSLAVAATMLVNVVYSAALKGVPVLDVVWCGVWGAAYAAITGASPTLLVVVGLMTAVCHLYQALDDRAADAASAITTTAVRSRALSVLVLGVLVALLGVALRPALGLPGAVSAATPLAVHLLVPSARIGWLATKAYFGVVWLCLLGLPDAFQ